jgi:hypothetical protein
MLKKPTAKTVTSVALAGGAIVLGAKIGDGVSAVMPASTNSYKRWILGVGGIVAAACINPSTTAAQAVQNGLLGLGAKQLYDEATDALAEAVPVKVSADATALGATDRFVNALVGHKEVPVASLGAAWMGDNSDNLWDRPLEEEAPAPLLSFSGV